VGAAKLGGSGLVYHGMELLGGGAVLAGLVLGAVAALIIDRRLKEAALWSFAGAVLAFFGFIHGTQLGWAMSPQVALGYALFGAVCLAASMQSEKAN
jgi:AGZA family xanthine/uracil permease-like MFS transporter